MFCIKKNKCFSTVLLLSKKQTAYFSPCNPFRPVETRSNLSKHVQTCWNAFPPLPLLPRWNLSKHVSIRSDLSKHVSIRSDLLKHVQINTFKPVETRSDLLKHVSPPPSYPLLPPPTPFSPFLGRGREGEEEGKPGNGSGQIWTDWNVFRHVQTG